jgi:rod shape determining protein RodA
MLANKVNIDWVLFFSVAPLLGAGLITMYSFAGDNYFFNRQIVWIIISLITFFSLSFGDYRFLRRGGVLMSFYIPTLLALLSLVLLGTSIRGAQSWLSLGLISFQPSGFMSVILILILSKYFSRRHVEIAHIRHIIVSGVYAFVPFLLIFLQPDFGSAIIIFLIWIGMIMVSGVSKKHLLLVFLIGTLSFSYLWFFGFTETQKDRILSFVYPKEDLLGAGYNAFQSEIAVGSGQLFGKGIGYGTQSRLSFLPEYQTDFIFAAFSEEWGLFGTLIMFLMFGILLTRILINSYHGDTNFEILFGMGLAIFIMSHLTIHVGMNIGLLPVTGLTLPFVSYGGSHLLSSFIGLGILMGMRRYQRITHRENIDREFVGL